MPLTYVLKLKQLINLKDAVLLDRKSLICSTRMYSNTCVEKCHTFFEVWENRFLCFGVVIGNLG